MEASGELGHRVPPRHRVTVLAFVTGLFFLAVLEPEVRRRPDLLERDEDRTLFADYLAAKGQVEG